MYTKACRKIATVILLAAPVVCANASPFRLIDDVYPGPSNGLSGFLVDRGPEVFFWGYTLAEVHGQPWKSDGTTSGTSMIGEYVGSSGSFGGGHGLVLDGIVYFVANDGFDGNQVWRSDGTAPGTYALTSTVGGTASSISFTAINGHVVFQGGSFNQGYALTVTDGTVAGTVILSTSIYANSSGVILNDQAVFPGSSGPDTGLVLTDGTSAGTSFVSLSSISGFGFGSGFSNTMVAVNDVIYFVGSDSAHGTELWKTDGTDVNTVLVKDIFPGTTGSSPSDLTRVDDGLFFVAATSDAGRELWKTDGTDAGTVRVKDIHPGLQDSTPEQLTALDGALYFVANDGASGKELWRSDGTDAGTTMLLGDLIPGSQGAFDYTYNTVQAVNDKLVLVLNTGTGSSTTTPFVSDGTLAGTQAISPTQGIYLQGGVVASNGKLLAAGNITMGQGNELIGADAFSTLGNTWCAKPEGGVPDADPVGFSSHIHLPKRGAITNLRVSTDIGHTFVGDLQITLRHEQSGTEVVLFDEPPNPDDPPFPGDTCKGDLLNIVFDDSASSSVQTACTNGRPAYPTRQSFAPANPLSTFNAESLAGDWTLSVSDNAPDDIGIVHEWCMNFSTDAIFNDSFD